MAICAHCKSQETQLFERGVPICIACAQGPSIKPKPYASEREIRTTLLQDLPQATAACHEANRQFEATASFPHPPRPDHLQSVKNASESLFAAHSRLNDYLERGIAPEGLKRAAKNLPPGFECRMGHIDDPLRSEDNPGRP